MKKYISIPLLSLIVLSFQLNGCTENTSNKSQNIDFIADNIPAAIDTCQIIDECAKYYYLNYTSAYSCMKGLTHTVLALPDAGDPSMIRPCAEQLNALLACENTFECPELVNAEYMGTQETLCPAEFAQYRACLIKNDSCLSNDDCKDGFQCKQNTCIAKCSTDADCDAGLICRNKECVAPQSNPDSYRECKTMDDCADGEFCIEALVPSDPDFYDGPEIKVGDKICSACPTDCSADATHPVCVAALHVCGAQVECPGDMSMMITNGYAVCTPNDLNLCHSDGDCEPGFFCNPAGICEQSEASYKYVRIDDMSPAGEGWDAGADIDAIVLDITHYAISVVDFKRTDGLDYPAYHAATNPIKALGKPDSLVSYPNTGSCNYFQNGSNSVGNKKCDLDASKGVPDETCDYDYSFVSLGGLGGYLVVEMDGEIKAGSKIDIVELGDCSLANTPNGSSNKAKAEEIKVSIAKSGDGDWKAVGEKSAKGGIASFTISPNIL